LIVTTDPRFDIDALLDELQAAGAVVKSRNSICCPFHDDTRPSSGVYVSEDGVPRFKCQADGCGFCGDLYDVRAKSTGKGLTDVLKSDKPNGHVPEVKSWPSVDAFRAAQRDAVVYQYTNPEDHKPDMIVARWDRKDGKRFGQYRMSGDKVEAKAPQKPWPLYNRIRLKSSDAVVVVEGEKCVHALHRIGIVATTNPGGAGKAKHAHWLPLAGKSVVLWPDNDDTGKKHMADVASILERLDPQPNVSVVDIDPLQLPQKGDVADYIASFGDTASKELLRKIVMDAMGEAEYRNPSDGLKLRLEAMASGRWRSEPMQWVATSKLTKALLPGTVTLLCGDPGATKSFAILEAMLYWHDKGIKACVFELEEDRDYHLHRALAQLHMNSDITDDEWVRENPDDALEAHAQSADFLDSFAPCIYDAPSVQPSLQDLAKWVRQRAEEGYRIICIDPITAAAVTGNQWTEDAAFMMAAKAAVREHDASLVLVTHPKKGRKGAIGQDELAGGAAYQRFAQTVLWLEWHKTPVDVKIYRRDHENWVTPINRTLHICKARNGKGQGIRIGMDFSSATLRTREKGIIEREHDD